MKSFNSATQNSSEPLNLDSKSTKIIQENDGENATENENKKITSQDEESSCDLKSQHECHVFPEIETKYNTIDKASKKTTESQILCESFMCQKDKGFKRSVREKSTSTATLQCQSAQTLPSTLNFSRRVGSSVKREKCKVSSKKKDGESSKILDRGQSTVEGTNKPLQEGEIVVDVVVVDNKTDNVVVKVESEKQKKEREDRRIMEEEKGRLFAEKMARVREVQKRFLERDQMNKFEDPRCVHRIYTTGKDIFKGSSVISIDNLFDDEFVKYALKGNRGYGSPSRAACKIDFNSQRIETSRFLKDNLELKRNSIFITHRYSRAFSSKFSQSSDEQEAFLFHYRKETAIIAPDPKDEMSHFLRKLCFEDCTKAFVDFPSKKQILQNKALAAPSRINPNDGSNGATVCISKRAKKSSQKINFFRGTKINGAEDDEDPDEIVVIETIEETVLNENDSNSKEQPADEDGKVWNWNSIRDFLNLHVIRNLHSSRQQISKFLNLRKE